MEPRIQYTQSADGTNIALWSKGKGTPIVLMPTTVIDEYGLDVSSAALDSLAARFQFVGYNMRGTGLSERSVEDLSVEALCSDLEAVVDHWDLPRFALVGSLHSGAVAVAYAAAHPERVSHLILFCAYARGVDVTRSPKMQALLPLIDVDWETYSETWAHVAMGWDEGDAARQAAALLRESVTPEMLASFFGAWAASDVLDLLPRISLPCLVVHRAQLGLMDVSVARDLAARIPGANLVIVQGRSGSPLGDDAEDVFRTIEEFVTGEGPSEPANEPSVRESGAFRTILFTDVEGSTALTQRLGDEAARSLLREHERITRDALTVHGGAEIKTMGDGFMTSFTSATKALECAIAMQRAFAARNESADEPVRIRIGLNAGEPIAEEEDLFGTAVILAARIASKATGAEILASEGVRQIVAGKRFVFSDRGDTEMRGFEDPVRVYEVSWRPGES